ncbi:MAG: sigma-70 family RNA polymerase sigma factor [Bacteroidetes bacterium]|nr:sigma-70 family RNA polymerase sigma factor [Bacteroidota bacterium]
MKTFNPPDEVLKTEETETIEAAKNDPARFRTLYEKYFKRIFLFVYHRVEDRDLASDLTSQIFLKAMQRIHQFNFRGLPFSSWLYRIAINECTDYFRRSKRSKVVYVEDIPFHHLFEEMFPEDPQSQLENKLHLVLQQLQPDELQIIELRFFEDMPFKMVAEILNISEIYAKVRTYRIIDKMKKIFLKLL